MGARYFFMPGMYDPEWKFDAKRGAQPEARTFRADNAAVQLDEVFDDREPQSQPAMPARCGGVALTEALEEMGQEVRFYSLAAVDHADFKVAVHPFEGHLHLSALGGELDGVGQQVPHALLEPRRIAAHGTGKWI